MELPTHYDSLTPKERKAVRERYITKQGGCCYHCKAPLVGPPSQKIMKKQILKSLFPSNFFKYPVHLHHCHDTGLTVGAVHNRCNAVLWQYHGE